MKPALHPGRLLARRYRLVDQIGAGARRLDSAITALGAARV